MQTKSIKQYSTLVGAFALTFFIIFLSSCGGDEAAPKPVADFTFVVDEATGLKVTFTNISENGVSYSWNFGVAGASSTVESPEHTYTTSGAYSVELTATGADGSTAKKSKTLALTAIPQNVLVNGNFATNTNWKQSQLSLNPESGMTVPVDLTFNNGLTFSSALVNGTGDLSRAAVGLIQQITLEPGTYEIRSSATLSEVGGAWFFISVLNFELNSELGEGAPEDDEEGAFTVLGADIGSDECKTYTGPLEDMTCLADSFIKTGKADGVFEITTAGTYYFTITAGQWESTFGTFKINNIGLYKIL
jgi:PKD repeat protein